MNEYKFVNKDGKEIVLNGSFSFEDLVKMGFNSIRLVDPKIPISKNEFRCEIKNEK